MSCCCRGYDEGCNYEAPRPIGMVFEKEFTFFLISRQSESHSKKMMSLFAKEFSKAKVGDPSKDGSDNWISRCSVTTRSGEVTINKAPIGSFTHNGTFWNVESEVVSSSWNGIGFEWVAKGSKSIWCYTIPEMKKAIKEIKSSPEWR